MSLNLFSLFISRGLSFRDLPLGGTKTHENSAPENFIDHEN